MTIRAISIATGIAVAASGGSAVAQHEHHPMAMPEPAPDQTAEVHEHGEMGGVLAVPEARNGAGTGWLPDDSPVRAAMWQAGGWDLMLHGNLFAGYVANGSDVGDDALTSENWVMGMAGHSLAGGRFELRGMYSLEPLTVGKDGYPLLLQTGETYQGEPLVDRQHPHDLIMETAAIYRRAVGGGVAVEAYAALAGEPALGPVAFPHRFSSMADPLAPLSHHWQDSTHISYGVLTAGAFTRVAKLEGSWFNGREPDEDRWDVDLRAPDSFSARLSVNPAAPWSLQASYGWLAEPETLEPGEAVQRWTASAVHARTDVAGPHTAWMTTAVWGRNVAETEPTTDSALLETAIDLGRFGVTFARAEYVVKTGHDLALAGMDEETFPIGGFTLGHVHPVASVSGVDTGVGVRGALDVVGDALATRYGTHVPYGGMVFVQLQPAKSW